MTQRDRGAASAADLAPGAGRPPAITSAANPRIRGLLRLRDRRGREESGLTLVDGLREIRRALAAGATIETAYVGPTAARGDGPAVVRALASAGVPVVEVGPTVEARLAFGDRNEGVVAVVRPPTIWLEHLRVPREPLLVILERVEKPGNLGAVLRSADGAGADAIIVADPLADPWNPNVIRASLGTVFSVPVAIATAEATLGWCRDRGIRLVAARVEAPMPYTEADLTGPVGLVLGSEASGLTAAWVDADIEAVRLPMLGVADSLNVSAAAAVLLYEALRQRAVRPATRPARGLPEPGEDPVEGEG
jgi:TrmH family RNA methyltransferase